MSPHNISAVGISAYNTNPNINAARGSAPDSKIEDIPDSM